MKTPKRPESALAIMIIPLIAALLLVMMGGTSASAASNRLRAASIGSAIAEVDLINPAELQSTQWDSFHFLEPLAPRSGHPERFDPDLLDYLTVEVCEPTATGCALVKAFTANSSQSERLRIDEEEGWTYFAVNWDTRRTNLGQKTYRVQVSVAGLMLGSIDLAPDTYNTFGRTWPIKFLIEKDPAIWTHLLVSEGDSMWEVADLLRSDLGICGDELTDVLLTRYPGATADEVTMVVDGVCQNAIIPDTTKIADRATRDALESFDPDSGRMVFDSATPLLRALRVGDVLVSRPGPAAPYGYLRKVTSISNQRDGLVLETAQAQLTEAISEGTLDVSGQLAPAPEASTSGGGEALGAATEMVTLAAIDEGDGFTFQQDIDETIVFEGQSDGVEGTGSLRVQGSVYFNAGYNVGLGIESCLALTLVCVDRFEAWAGGEQKSVLRVTGDFDGTISKEQLIAPIPMSPIVFFIGPVPVVIVPRMDVLLGVKGNAHARFVLDAKAESRIKVGAKWTDPDDGGIGWQNVSEFTPLSGEAFDIQLDADMQVEAYGKLDAQLLLYNAAGPGIDASIGIEGKVQAGERPYWQVRGHAVTGVNFSISLVLPVARWDQPVLDEHFQIDESEESPPIFNNFRDGAIQTRVGQSVYVGPTRAFDPKTYDVFDPEGDSFTLMASSAADATVTWPHVTFATPGLKTVTITARQADGQASTHQIAVDVRNDPPTVTITPDSGSVPATVQYWLNATAYDPEEGTLRCDRINWSASGSHTKQVSSNTRTCSAVFKFSEPGSHTVTVVATDSLGNATIKTHGVTVTEAPAVSYPEIELDSFSVQARSRIARLGDSEHELGCRPGLFCEVETGDFIYNGYGGDFIPPLIMRLTASEGATVQWFCQTGENFATVTDNGDGSYSCTPIYSATQPIKVYAYVSFPPDFQGEGPGPTVFSGERTYYMLQAPS